jgi:hypothetical protein
MTPYANRMLEIPLEKFYSFKMCCTKNNIIKTRCPRYFFSKIQFGQSSRMFNIIIPFHRSNRMSVSLFVWGSILWIDLPPDVKREGSENCQLSLLLQLLLLFSLQSLVAVFFTFWLTLSASFTQNQCVVVPFNKKSSLISAFLY